jgi:hypothetical protein
MQAHTLAGPIGAGDSNGISFAIEVNARIAGSDLSYIDQNGNYQVLLNDPLSTSLADTLSLGSGQMLIFYDNDLFNTQKSGIGFTFSHTPNAKMFIMSNIPMRSAFGVRITKTPDKKNDLFVVWTRFEQKKFTIQISSLNGKYTTKIDGMFPSIDDNTFVYIDQTTGQLLTRECQTV